MAARYVTQGQVNFVESESDDDILADITISDHVAAAEDIPLLFNELRLTYNRESLTDIQRLSEATDAERDALADFEHALDKLNDSNADKNKSCASCSKEVRVENVSIFKRGQHISMPGQKFRKYDKYTHRLMHSYRHHAIIKSVQRTAGTRVEMEVIHFYEEDNCRKICQSLKTYDLKNDEIYIVEYDHPKYTSEEIVSRAESMLPENGDDQREFRKYNLGTSNCEHFATWCVVGEGESFQVQGLRQKIADKLKILFGDGSHPIAKVIFKLLYQSSDEIAAGLAKAVNIQAFVLSGTLTLYLLYCIIMTVLHIKDYYNDQMCWSCLKGRLRDLWMTLGAFVTTSAISVIFVRFALPLMGPAVGIPLEVLIILMSVALGWSVPKIIKALQNPFSVEVNEIKEISEVEIGDVISLKYYMLEHNVVVTEVHEDDVDPRKGKIRGVHYGLPSLFGTREVMEDYFTVDLTKSGVNLLDCSHLLTYAPEMVVQRARKRVGEKKWSMASYRSDLLCFWAKVQQRPRGTCEIGDNGNLDASGCKDLSSLFVEKKEIHIDEELRVGDVIKYDKRGILIEKVNLDDGNGRQVKIKMIVYDSMWCGRLKTYFVDLKKDHIHVEIYHPAHCHPMAVRANRAERMRDKKGKCWTTTGFIYDCIMLNPQ